jgi:muconolactone delta-isomerase
MLFLVELDHVKSGVMLTPDAVRSFIEQIIFPTIARAEQLLAEKKILAGGPVVGRIALRFIVEADSPQEVDLIITGLPLWPLAETRVTPLIAFSDRRKHVQSLLKNLAISRVAA